MKKLLIVESPAKIKTISKFLGSDFKIMSTVGHIKDLPQKELGVTFNKEIKIDYVVMEGKEKTINDIKKEASKADVIYLAPDPDREGEIIAWHVEQEINKVVKDKDNIHRITFNEITKSAIEEAVAHPSTVDLYKVSAQQARRILDRLVGYEVSPILWKKITKGLSAGRVQSVALKLICDREEAIKSFKPEEYWSIESLFSSEAGKLVAQLDKINKKKIDINNEKDAKEIVKKIKEASYIIESIKDSKRLKNPVAPFMTSTLQQSAYNQLGYQVQRTMQCAQKLYEGIVLDDPSAPVALITYMRTDSLRISDVALDQVRKFITKNYSKDYLPSKANVYSKSKAQDAHEAIRPIDVNITPEFVKKYATAEVAKLYELIWKRFVSCQMKPAEYAQRQVVIQGGEFTFKVTGSTLIFDGYLKVYTDESEDDDTKISIPKDIKEKMPVDLKEVNPKQHFTQPPARFSEATLVKELEKEGIGRPSTYATILKTIQARSYTVMDSKKRFQPTDLGIAVTKMLEDNLPKIMDVKFTAGMEEQLDKIANGDLERDKLLFDFHKDFEKDLEAFRGQEAKRSEKTDLICPKCNKANLLIRFGKSGPFLGCSAFPDCKFTSNFERLEDGSIKITTPQEPQTLEEKCPKCGKQLRQLVGKYGPFISCSGYPDCTYIKPTLANFKCPLCKSDVIQRTWKGKKFWGCSSYPKCNFSVAGETEDKVCPQCKWPFLVKKYDKDGNVNLICANKDCSYKS